MVDERQEQLKQWLTENVGMLQFDLHPASEDASFRRYFRVNHSGESRIIMDAPPSHENSRPFIDIAQRLATVGLNVPEVIHDDLLQGFLLLSDLGDCPYLQQLNTATVQNLYGDALGALVTMQACANTEGLPIYDENLLMTEMDLFKDWLVARYLNLTMGTDEQGMLNTVFETLATSALHQPQVFVHRDYHSRNLMMNENHNPGILDFQDAVLGPVTYDLVSLLKDCYIEWPFDQVEAWAAGYFDLAVQSGVMLDQHEVDFLRWFHLMGVQRHLKASGIFARLYLRDGKQGYLKDIPRTLAYIQPVAERYEEVKALGEFVSQRVLPAFRDIE